MKKCTLLVIILSHIAIFSFSQSHISQKKTDLHKGSSASSKWNNLTNYSSFSKLILSEIENSESNLN